MSRTYIRMILTVVIECGPFRTHTPKKGFLDEKMEISA